MEMRYYDLNIEYGSPQINKLKRDILHEAHNSRFSVRHSGTRMYGDLHNNFRWPGRTGIKSVVMAGMR